VIASPTYSAALPASPGVAIDLSDNAGAIVLDAGRWPHVEGNVSISMDDPTILDHLDPRANRRLRITAGGRAFDLGIRDAQPDRDQATVRVSLASDEALLDDFAQLTDDTGAWSRQASLRAIVNYVLGKIGAALQPGPEDANLTAKWDSVNLLVNPNLTTSLNNWTTVGTSAFVRNAGVGFGGIAGYAAATASAVNYEVWPEGSRAHTNAPAIRAGEWYTASIHTRIAVGSATCRARIYWWDDNGGLVSSVTGTTTNLTTASSTFQRISVTGLAPANAVRASALLLYVGASGNVVHVDAAMLSQGRFIPDYYDGATPGDSTYSYGWTGDPNASNSARTVLVDAPDPEAFVWPAGVSAIEFLRPLVQAAGYRLVCDELRRWTLRAADHRADGGLTYRAGVNIHTASEVLSREDEDWCDGMVVRYRWVAGGLARTRDDVFALPGATKIVLREIEAPYPGPGRAEYAVKRAQGRGRTITLDAQATWAEAVEQPLSITLDGSPIQTGITNRVEFDIARNTVTVTSRTTDTPSTAWILVRVGERWIDSPAGEPWTKEAI